MENTSNIIKGMKEIEAEVHISREEMNTNIADNEKLQHFHSLLETAEKYYQEANIGGIMNQRNANRSLATNKYNDKPNVQIFQEILELHDRPMHISDILYWAQRWRVEFHGTADPKTQLRNSLNGAKTRFINVGNNTWCLADKPIPENPSPSANENHSNPTNPRTPGHTEKE